MNYFLVFKIVINTRVFGQLLVEEESDNLVAFAVLIQNQPRKRSKVKAGLVYLNS